MNSDDLNHAVPALSGAVPPKTQWRNKMELLIVLAFVVGWFVLQIWVLPKMGVRT